MREQMMEFIVEWIRASESVVEGAVDREVIGGLWEQFAYEREELVAEFRDEFFALAAEMWREARGVVFVCGTVFRSTYHCECGTETLTGSIARTECGIPLTEIFCSVCGVTTVLTPEPETVRGIFSTR